MTHTGTPNSRPWYSLSYTDVAPDGLPPVLQADQVIRYRDQADTWLAALWHSPEPGKPSNCILRVNESYIIAITEHTTLAAAAGHLT